jgi:hypothetical protein
MALKISYGEKIRTIRDPIKIKKSLISDALVKPQILGAQIPRSEATIKGRCPPSKVLYGGQATKKNAMQSRQKRE